MQQVIELLIRILFMFLVVVFLHGVALGDEKPITPGTTAPAEVAESAAKILLIGNSLTWDARPPLLDGTVHWHVDCGKSLLFIKNNPEAPCVASSRLWPAAMAETQYGFVGVQPHYGTTLAEDVTLISEWVQQQKKAVFVIHTGWAKHEFFEKERADADPAGLLTHSDLYFNTLLDNLRQQFPDREFRCTRAMNLLFQISDDIESGKAPFEKITDVYRDPIHMKTDTGRYLMHNAVRIALGQPISKNGFPEIAPEVRTYLNGLLRNLETEARRQTAKNSH